MQLTLFSLKVVLVLFWGAWFAVVFLTNLFGAMKSFGMLPPSWKFASKNYDAVVKATSIYRPASWVPRILFVGVVLWQLIAAALYLWAFAVSVAAHAIVAGPVNAAFGTGIALWAAFMLADEITIKYGYEQSHELLFMAQLVTLLAIYLLP